MRLGLHLCIPKYFTLRLFSNVSLPIDYRDVLGLYQGKEFKKLTRFLQQNVNRKGETPIESSVLKAVWGHEFKEEDVSPNPHSTRWRESFLKIGAFRKRSERLEVRTKEYLNEEAMGFENQPKEKDPTSHFSDNKNEHLDEYVAYAVQELAKMDDIDSSQDIDGDLQLSETGHRIEKDKETFSEGEYSIKTPIEFRSAPFALSNETSCRKRVFEQNWMPSGHRTTCMNRFSMNWMCHWLHMWSPRHRTSHGMCTVPSSIRRFRFPVYRAQNGPPSYYVEDNADHDKQKNNRVSDLTTSILTFLDHYCTSCMTVSSDARRIKFKRVAGHQLSGAKHWAMIHRLSQSIRTNTFKFCWEDKEHFLAKLHKQTSIKRKRQVLESPKQRGFPVFHPQQLLKHKHRAEIHQSSFQHQKNIFLRFSRSKDHDAH